MELTDNNFIDFVCAHVAQGGSAIDFCQFHSVRYNDFSAYLYQHPDKLKQYNHALSTRNEWYIQRVMLELGRISTIDIRTIYNPDGTLRDITSLPPEVAALVSSVEAVERTDDNGVTLVTKKIKFWDKMKALELLGKNLMLFIDRVDHRLQGDINIVINVDKPKITADELSCSGSGIHGIRTQVAENN